MEEDRAANQRSLISVSFTLALYISNGFGLRKFFILQFLLQNSRSYAHFSIAEVFSRKVPEVSGIWFWVSPKTTSVSWSYGWKSCCISNQQYGLWPIYKLCWDRKGDWNKNKFRFRWLKIKASDVALLISIS